MCIAIYSLPGVDLPAEDTLNNCFVNNPDGAGFAFSDKGQVEIVKGLMTYEDFRDTLHEYDRRYGLRDRGVLIHFRIATHGDKVGSCCHPFPVSFDERCLKKTRCRSNYACVHNGIITLCTKQSTAALSDTMVFIRDYLSRLATNRHWFGNSHNMKLIENLIDSKMAILNGQGQIRSTSGFRQGPDGNFYSNDSYRMDYCATLDLYGSYRSSYPGDEGPLMRMKPGEALCLDDGSTEEYEEGYHDVYPILLTETDEVYTCYDGMKVGSAVDACRLTYLGTGFLVSEANPADEKGYPRPIPFRKDLTSYVWEGQWFS